MRRIRTSHTHHRPIRAIGCATLALLAPGMAASAPTLGHSGDARPLTTPAALPGAQSCATMSPFGLEGFLCYRAAANLANEHNIAPRAGENGNRVVEASVRTPRYGPTRRRVAAENARGTPRAVRRLTPPAGSARPSARA